MANPASAVEVHGAAVDGSVIRRDPDALVAEIDRTRENLARTIDALAERVSPANNMRKLRARAAELGEPGQNQGRRLHSGAAQAAKHLETGHIR